MYVKYGSRWEQNMVQRIREIIEPEKQEKVYCVRNSWNQLAAIPPHPHPRRRNAFCNMSDVDQRGTNITNVVHVTLLSRVTMNTPLFPIHGFMVLFVQYK